MRKIKEIVNERNIVWDKVWYGRCQPVMQKKYLKDKNPESRKAYKKVEKLTKKMEKKYGKKNLGPYDDFELAMLLGRLETLRWVLGEDWGSLDN